MPLILTEKEIDAIKKSLHISYAEGYHNANDLLELLSENADYTKWVVMSPKEYKAWTGAD